MSKEKYFVQPPNGQSHFAQVPGAEIERSKFDRSHSYKTAFDGGQLIPVFVDEVLPGDTFHMSSTAFARLATPLKPFMDNAYLDTHFFFVPYRLVWDNWQKFMGERVQPTDDPNIFTIPQTTIAPANTSLKLVANYMGIPHMSNFVPGQTINVSALPFRAYQLIWNEWYRDENLIPSIVIDTGNGPDDYRALECLYRGKRKDYFTGALPWPQKGDPVTIPLGATAPVVGIPGVPPTFKGLGGLGPVAPGTTLTFNTDAATKLFSPASNVGAYTNNTTAEWAGLTGLEADLTNATAVTINELRTAFQIQRLLERDARGGTRYIELILSHFGVRSDDARLQRPEFLGGGTSMLNINPVAQTNNEIDSPQANLAAVGTGVNKAGFTKSFTEHGIIIGLISARADLTYQQGVERFWSRKTRYDFYWPALSHLGEQEVKNKELFLTGSADPVTGDEAVFGYQERYAEYRYKPSRITGLMSSEQPTSLDVWHLAQDFDSLPGLNYLFIGENPPFKRVSAVPSQPDFILDMWFSLQCDRPMPVYSVPGLIDHF